MIAYMDRSDPTLSSNENQSTATIPLPPPRTDSESVGLIDAASKGDTDEGATG